MILSTKLSRSYVTKTEKGSHLKGFASKAIHAGYSRQSSEHHPVVPPIINSTAFEYETIDFPKGTYGYSRISNPNRNILEKTIAALEDAEYGLCFSSGLASVFAISYLLNPGDHMVCAQLIYGGSIKQMRDYPETKGVEISYVHPPDPSNIKKAIKKNTKMVFIEALVNPLLNVVDLKAVSDVVKSHPGIILAVDNTFMTPYFLKPLNAGADIVMNSLSKYMNGHGDVIMGSVSTNRQDLYEKLHDILTMIGLVPSPRDCAMVHRSLKTLHIRMREHQNNAFAVAKFLDGHPVVEKVLYPGLPSHPQHELAKKQCKGFGGMVAFYIRGGKKEVETLLTSLELVTNTGSLGQPESLISYPAGVSHYYIPEEERKVIGITDNFVRMSVGLETEEDIINDLRQAFEKLQTK